MKEFLNLIGIYKNISNSIGFAFNIPKNLDSRNTLNECANSIFSVRDNLKELTGVDLDIVDPSRVPEKRNCIAVSFLREENNIVGNCFCVKVDGQWMVKKSIGSQVQKLTEKEVLRNWNESEILKEENKDYKDPIFFTVKKSLIESINIKREFDGKTLDVELDADFDLGDGKKHVIKSKDLILNLTKKGSILDLEINVESDVKEENDKNIDIYNKKLPFDMRNARRAGVPENIAETLYLALADLSEKKIGALIAVENDENLDKYCENGKKMKCPISKDIFISIFYPGTDVHDGATVIKNGVIKYSSVFFKNISGDNFAEHYGARHRAAMGISKETDAFCIVVSEETGNISFAINGKLYVIRANDVKKSKARFMKLFNEHTNTK